MGEGVGALILESLKHIQECGVKILGKIVGYGTTSDAYHITSPDLQGTQTARAMEMRVNEAKTSLK